MFTATSSRKSTSLIIDKNDRAEIIYSTVDIEKNKIDDTYLENIPEEQSRLLIVNSQILKYGSLILLMLQNAIVTLIMRYVRTRSTDLFVSSTAVVMAEFFKMCACLFVIFVNEKFSVKNFANHLYTNICQLPMDCLRISVPSVIYVIQNNLLYVAISNLNAATFQVSYQLKILTTALLSVLILKVKLSRLQWLSLGTLFVGVALIQLPSDNVAAGDSSGSNKDNVVVGMLAVTIACTLSGFAGVYLEKILKGTNPSLWLRNVQLGFLGVLFGLCTVFVSDWTKISEKGFFFGYDWVVWLVVCLQSFGGLVVAVTVKYADNILKGFATSAAIIMSCVVSIFFFDFQMSGIFAVGTTLVLISTYTYSKFVIPK